MNTGDLQTQITNTEILISQAKVNNLTEALAILEPQLQDLLNQRPDCVDCGKQTLDTFNGRPMCKTCKRDWSQPLGLAQAWQLAYNGMSQARTITLKYSGKCAGCSQEIKAGSQALWQKNKVLHGNVTDCVAAKVESL